MHVYFTKEAESSYQYVAGDGKDCHATEEMKEDFDENGFVIVRGLFSQNEIDKLCAAFDGYKDFWGAEFGVQDSHQRTFYQSSWKEVGQDIIGLANRTVKLVNTAEELLNRGELYLYSGKVIMKQEKTGGALLWHQDYGYWYNNRCLFPDFVTSLIALTKSDKENGGLQVLKGSNKCGRIEHGRKAGQTGADLERIQLLENVLERVYCNLKAGDAIFFHSCTLHQSDANWSEFKRWNLIYSLNARHNSPDLPHYNNQYGPETKIDKVPADAVQNCQDLSLEKRNFIDPNENKNISFVEGAH